MTGIMRVHTCSFWLGSYPDLLGTLEGRIPRNPLQTHGEHLDHQEPSSSSRTITKVLPIKRNIVASRQITDCELH